MLISFFYLLLLFVSLLLIFKINSFLLNSALNRDSFWLLETGNYILNTFSIPETDLFSWTISSKKWIVYQWFFELLIAFITKIFGLSLLIKIYALLVFLIYFILPIKVQSKTPFLLNCLICSFCLYAACANLAIRPLMITSLFLLLQYILIKYYIHKKISIWFLIILYILWANMHTGVFLGLFSLVIYALSAVFQKKYILAKTIFQYICICFFASLINPYFYKIYTYLFNLSLQTYFNIIIDELKSPNFHDISPKVFLFLFISCLFIPRKFYKPELYLHILIFGLITFLAARFIIWSSLFMALGLPTALYKYLKSINYKNEIIFSNNFAYLYIFGLFIGAFILLGQANNLGECAKLAKAEKFYISYLHKNHNTKILNDDLVGSCLLSKNKVFIDSRFDFYGIIFVRALMNDFLLAQNSKNYLNKWKPNIIFIQKHWPVCSILRTEPNYKLLYEDNFVLILGHT